MKDTIHIWHSANFKAYNLEWYTTLTSLRGIKDWVQGFFLNQFYAKWRSLKYYIPPLLFSVTPFPAMPTNSLAVPSSSLRVYQCNMRNLREQRFTNVFAPICSIQLAQLFIYRNSWYRFPKHWNWQIRHDHLAFEPPLCTFSGMLQTFPMVKEIVHSSSPLENSIWVISKKIAAKWPLWCLFKCSWHVLPYMVHMTPLWGIML